MAKREQQHRHALEQADLSTRSRLASRGQVMAFLLGVAGIGGGLLLAGYDKSLAGMTAFAASLATLIGIFIYTRKKERS